jgi:nitric oxide reductase NorD protein
VIDCGQRGLYGGTDIWSTSWRVRESLGNHHEASDALQRWGLLASALSGRTLQVATAPGQPPWTDGNTVYLDPGASVRNQLKALAVQASLLAAGSLAPDIARRLSRHPALTRRYLGLEGHRALAANESLLPPAARSLVDRDMAGRSDSPAASLALALSRAVIGDAPACFGVIRARNLLVSIRRGRASSAHGAHVPRRQRNSLASLDGIDHDDFDDVVDIFSSPVGSGGALGRLFTTMLGVVRRLNDGGPLGADAPTHRRRSGARGGGNAVFSTGVSSLEEDNAVSEGHGTKYPEWDIHRRCYRPDWCTVQ